MLSMVIDGKLDQKWAAQSEMEEHSQTLVGLQRVKSTVRDGGAQ